MFLVKDDWTQRDAGGGAEQRSSVTRLPLMSSGSSDVTADANLHKLPVSLALRGC